MLMDTFNKIYKQLMEIDMMILRMKIEAESESKKEIEYNTETLNNE